MPQQKFSEIASSVANLTSADKVVGVKAATTDVLFSPAQVAAGFVGTTLKATGYALDSVNAQTGTTYTLQASDNGRYITLTNAGAITLTCPSGLGAAFSCGIIQGGAGAVTVAAGGGATLASLGSSFVLAGQNAMATIIAPAANAFKLAGQLAGGGSGVSSLNALTGALSLVAGANVTITPAGSNITIASSGGGAGTVNVQTGTAYTMQVSDNNNTVTFNNAGNILVTCPTGLGVGFACQVVQLGAGKVNFIAGSGATVNAPSGNTALNGQYAAGMLTTVTATSFILWGGEQTTPTLPVAYAGVGDVVAGAVRYYGTRAYSLATVGTNAIRLRRDSDNSESDFATVAGGGLDLTAITTFKGAANLFVTKLYEQTGTVAGAAGPVVQATAANQPAFILSGLGTLPVIRFLAANSTQLGSAPQFVDILQPFTVSFVAKRTGAFSAEGPVLASADRMGFNNAANQVTAYAGSAFVTASATDSVMHACQFLINAASTNLNVDGSTNLAGNPGTGGLIVTGAGPIIGYGGGLLFTGDFVELAIWASGLTTGQMGNLSTNQHAYGSF